jgi:hypothetical protein
LPPSPNLSRPVSAKATARQAREKSCIMPQFNNIGI